MVKFRVLLMNLMRLGMKGLTMNIEKGVSGVYKPLRSKLLTPAALI